MDSVRSNPLKSARRSLDYFLNPKFVKNSARDHNTLPTDSTMIASRSKNTFNEKTLSTEFDQSDISSPRLKKDTKLPPIKFKNIFIDHSGSIDSHHSFSSIKHKPLLSPIEPPQNRRALSRIISIPLTPLHEDSIIEILSPTKPESRKIHSHKKSLFLASIASLSKTPGQTTPLDNINLLKTLLSEKEKSLKQQIALVPARFRTKTSNKFLSLKHAKSILWQTHSTLASLNTNISKTAEQITNSDHYDEKVITNCQTAVLGQENLIKKAHEAILQILPLSKKIPANRHSLPEMEIMLKEIIAIAKESQNYELHLYCAKISARLHLEFAEIQKAIFFFRLYKNIATFNKSTLHKGKAFKYLGQCYQLKQNYERSLSYFIKMFNQAIIGNNETMELQAYDYIGKQCFYDGDLQKANYFHTKFIRGITEEEGSNLRKLIISKHTNPYRVFKFRPIGIKEEDFVSSDEETDLPLGKDYESFAKKDLLAREGAKANGLFTKQMVNSQLELTFAKKERSHLHRLGVMELIESQKDNGIIEAQGVRGDSKLSHLSPNRLLESFIASKGQGMSVYQYMESPEGRITKKSQINILKILGKFQLNLNNAKSALSNILNEHLET